MKCKHCGKETNSKTGICYWCALDEGLIDKDHECRMCGCSYNKSKKNCTCECHVIYE